MPFFLNLYVFPNIYETNQSIFIERKEKTGKDIEAEDKIPIPFKFVKIMLYNFNLESHVLCIQDKTCLIRFWKED